MKVIEYLNQTDKPFISFELIPPKRGGTATYLIELIEEISKYKPPFIDVTSHPSEVTYKETPLGIKKRLKKKRPGTLGICAIIQHKFQIEAVPHILCRGFTREETEDYLIDFNYLGINNVFAVQGDYRAYKKPIDRSVRSTNYYALDLVKQISNMNGGTYLDDDTVDAEPTNFCIGVTGYPEKHYEAPNLTTDIKFTKKKIEAGASYIVTQMFFDNEKYLKYVDICRNKGINVPIIPGIKILTKKSHITTLPRQFFVDVPEKLSDKIQEVSSDKEAMEIGIEWAEHQIEELIQHNVPGIHLYIAFDADAICQLVEELRLHIIKL
jgi:methylenetetrahydrofolate reductase (NADPH)